MTRELKVYGYRWFRYDLPGAANGNKQSREIIAAHSVAEVLRLTNLSRSDFNNSGGETGNKEEIALAMSKPGTVFYRGQDDRTGDWKEFNLE